MKTVKQLADELGVAKQTINNNKPDDMPYTKIKNINHIDEELEKVITENIKNSPRYQDERNNIADDIGNEVGNNQEKELELLERNQELQEQNNLELREEIKRLHHQLATKDEQINKYSELLRNQQVLALDSNKKVEKLESQMEQEQEHQIKQENKSSTSKGLISRLFSRK